VVHPNSDETVLISGMFAWGLLHVAAWSFGLRAVYRLRDEFDRKAKTWSYLIWGVWSCLIMEAAMLGTAYISGLALVSVLTGIAGGTLFFKAFRSFQADLCESQSTLFGDTFSREGWDRRLGWSLFIVSAFCIAGGQAFPTTAQSAVLFLEPVEGSVWLFASGWLIVGFLRSACPADEARIYTPKLLAGSFSFAFLGAALTPASWLTGIPIPHPVRALLGALFILTLAIAFYGMVLRVHSLKLTRTLKELADLQKKLFEVEKLAAVGTVAAGAAHDFGNILAVAVLRSCVLLEDSALSPHLRRELEKVKQSLQSASEVTGNLMGLARRRAGPGSYADLQEVVAKPLDLFAHDLRVRNIEIIRQIENVASQSLDLGLLAHVCLNLYINARDAMQPKGEGTLKVSLAKKGKEAKIRVSDTGTGIPEDFRSKVFQAFESTKGDSGTGLGLSGSKAIIESMGGKIWFKTASGRGTTFYVRLPINEGPKAEGVNALTMSPRSVNSRLESSQIAAL